MASEQVAGGWGSDDGGRVCSHVVGDDPHTRATHVDLFLEISQWVYRLAVRPSSPLKRLWMLKR